MLKSSAGNLKVDQPDATECCGLDVGCVAQVDRSIVCYVVGYFLAKELARRGQERHVTEREHALQMILNSQLLLEMRPFGVCKTGLWQAYTISRPFQLEQETTFMCTWDLSGLSVV